MPLFGAFAPSVSAMLSQSHALNVIGTNIANVNTGGYRRIDTHFSSLVSAPLVRNGGIAEEVTEVSNSSDFGGVQPKDYNRISQQGRLEASQNNLDLAINGKGFFILNTLLGGAGQTLYTRDGALQLVKGPKTTGVGDDGNPITPDTAFLADKNGYLIQGFPVGSNGTFPSTGTPADIRLDPYAFSSQFLPTTAGNITFNLPAGADATPSQIDLIEIVGTPEAGDTYSVTVDGTTISTTVTAGQTLNDVRDALITAINADATVGATVTAIAGSDGIINLTAAQINTAFTASASATNGGVIADNSASDTVLVEATDPGDLSQVFGFEMVDSAGATQVITVLFDKVDENIWEMRTQNNQIPVAQVDTLTLAGTVETGDVYSISINGNAVNYTVQAGDTTIDDVRDGLLAAIGANPTINNAVTATAGGTGVITLTAKTAGTPFTSVASSNDLNVAQVDTVTIAGTVGALEAGDTYTVTVDGTPVTYTLTGAEGSITTVRNNLIAAINADPTVGALVTAAPGAGAGDITLTAAAAGTPFTTTAAATDIAGGVNDSTVVSVTTTTGSTNDNTATVATTTANVPPQVFSSPTTLTFDGSGLLTSANTINLSFDFGGGATGTMALNLNDVTQFAGEFLIFDFNRDGFGQAQLQTFTFDTDGVITGKFSDGSFRKIYKIPLAEFVNADGLALRNGNTFAETMNSGEALVTVAGGDGFATFLPNTHEVSNVDIAEQFSQLIKVETAYNSAAKTFATVDSMLEVARDLKR